MAFIWIALGVLTAALVYVALRIRRVGLPTTGPKIDRDTRQSTALIVVDMQSDFTSALTWDRTDLDRVMARVSALAGHSQQTGAPVIAIRQVFSGWLANRLNAIFNEGRGNAGSEGIALDPNLNLRPDAEFEKSIGDAFSSSALNAFLGQNQIGTVVLTGLDGCHCVKNTAMGALNRGYRVRIDRSAVLAADGTRWAAVQERLAQAGVEFID